MKIKYIRAICMSLSGMFTVDMILAIILKYYILAFGYLLITILSVKEGLKWK